MDDRELVEAALTGNPFGFPAIFDCHAAPVHDLALALLRDQRRALDVVESTFLEAGLKLHDLPEELRLPVWLLALAGRKCALRSGGAVRGDWLPSFPEDDVRWARLANLVWEAVAELPLRERTLLDLELRHGLEGEALTGALGLALGASLGQVQDLQAGLAGREASLSAHLVARTGGGCADLARRLDGWDGRFAPSDPHHLTGHVQGCPDCARSAAGLPSPFSLYAAALAAPYPMEARDRVLDRVVVPTGPPPAPEPEAPGPPPRSPAPDAADPRFVASTQFQRSAPAVIRSRPRPRSVGSPAAPGPSGPTQPDRPSTPPAPLLVLKLRPDHPPDHPPDQQPGPGPAGSPTAAASVLVAPPPDAPAPAAAGGSGRDTARPRAGSPAPPQPRAAEPWLPDGFPPPSFAGEGLRAGRRSSAGGVRWLAAFAILGAVLMAAGALLIANRDDGQTSLAADVTATSDVTVPTTVPTTGTAETAAAPAAPGQAASVPGGARPAAAVTTTTARPAPVAGSGSLVPAFDSLRLPRVDSTEAPQSGRLPLRNTGSAPVTYTARSSFPGLTVDRTSATLDPGATTELTVTLDGSKAPEGELSATLTFEGSGGTRQVGVTATVGRPPVIKDDAGEPCTNDVTPCSRLIRLEDPVSGGQAPATPCNSRWRYSVTVEDESRLSRVRADADRPEASGDLTRDGAATGPGGRWQSQVFEPVPLGAALTFTIRAVDAFDFFSSRTVRRIVC